MYKTIMAKKKTPNTKEKPIRIIRKKNRFKQHIQTMLFQLGYDVMPCLKTIHDLAIYNELYNADSLAEKCFYNIGAGSFRHPYWTNVDHYSEWYTRVQSDDMIEWDLFDLSQCPIESETAEIVYSSHTIEHITDEAAINLFHEAYRILKPGGIVRLTTHDADLFSTAYKRGDPYFFSPNISTISLEQMLLKRFATQLMRTHPEPQIIRPSDKEIQQNFEQQPLEEALNSFTQLCSINIQRKYPGDHINWWNVAKCRDMLHAAGFVDTWRSSYGQSCSPVLRNTVYFDRTLPEISMYFEGQKDK